MTVGLVKIASLAGAAAPLLAAPALAAAAEEGGAGMPQFDVSTFPTQLFWLAVTLILFYFAMRTIALPRIGNALEERRRKIDDDLDKAGRHREEAEAAMAAYEKALADAVAEAQAVQRQTAQEIAKRATERRSELAARLAAEAKEAESRIAAAKEPALASLRDVAAEVVQDAAARLTGIKVSKADADAAVSSSFKESA